MTSTKNNLRWINRRGVKILYRHPLKSGIFATALLVLSVLMLGSSKGELKLEKSQIFLEALGYITVYNAISVFIGAIAVMTMAKTLTTNAKRIRPTWKNPPRYCLDLLLPPDEAEHRVAVLKIAFARWRKIHSLNRARWIYITQCGGIIVSFWTNWAMKKIGLLKIIDRIFDAIGKFR